MTEIKRYQEYSYGVEETVIGEFVKHEDHAAIVAALQEQLSNYSMSAGQADQRKSESDTVRVALGFSADADDVAPCDLVDAIAAIQEQVRSLAAENEVLRNVFGPGEAVLNFLTIALRHTTYDEIDLSDVSLAFKMSLPETPATDAVIREIRAQAVDDFGIYHNFSDKQLIQAEAKKYAAAIRSGGQP